MKYINQTTGQICYIADIRKNNPTVSIPDGANCDALGYSKLQSGPVPPLQQWHDIIEGDIVNNIQQWSLVPWDDARILQDIESRVLNRLDNFAKLKGYSDIKSAISYSGCGVPHYDSEGTYCKMKQAETWSTLYKVIEDYSMEYIKTEGYAFVESKLPGLNWDEVIYN